MRRPNLPCATLPGFAALFLLQTPAFAQDWKGAGRIEGVVTDEAGGPIPGATLKANCAERGGGTTIQSDKKGHFVLGGIVGCNWAFDVSATGYEPKQIAIRLPGESARLAPVKVPLKRAAAGASPELQAAAAKADAAYKEGRFAEARAEYEALIAMRPDLAPTAYQQIGFSYVQEKQFDRAVESLEKVLAADPGNAQIRAIAAQAALEGRMVDKARSLLGSLDETQISADVCFNMGINFFNAGEVKDAVAYFTKTLAKDATYVDAYYRRALAYLGQGQMAEAKADFQKVVELAPEDAPTLVTKAKYSAIQDGMSLSEVQTLVGSLGEESGRTGSTVVQTWKNPDGSRLQVTFSNGLVTAKIPADLPDAAVMREMARKALEQLK